MEKIFLLGVGCQKGGTTWLHSQLDKCNDVDMGFIKEYHVFDTLYIPEFEVFYNEKIERFKKLKLDKRIFDKDRNLFKHLSFYLDVNNYFEYFDYLWSKGGDISLVGDITPSYAALPKEAFIEIKAGLEARGFKVKVIFIMRDPIERCWSVTRMNIKNRFSRDSNLVQPNEQEYLIKKYKSYECEIRTRYEATIHTLESVFHHGDIYYSLYENLFEKNTINEIRDFLHISDFSPDVDLKINNIEKNNELLALDETVEKLIFDHYRYTYDFCNTRFGIKGVWLGSKFL